MRGKESLYNRTHRYEGITPAYAGKRPAGNIRTPRTRDHPRVCGEKCDVTNVKIWPRGSPPRMRGQVNILFVVVFHHRITPAYAGKSTPRSSLYSFTQDHPRVCGEKSRIWVDILDIKGSPPRMRGKVCKRWKDCFPVGDHPRVCGEKPGIRKYDEPHSGSPPRMRGKGTFRSHHRCKPRITPAYAGKRLKRSHSIDRFSSVTPHFRSVLHKLSASGGSRAKPGAPPDLPDQNAVPASAACNWAHP